MHYSILAAQNYTNIYEADLFSYLHIKPSENCTWLLLVFQKYLDIFPFVV